MGLKCVFRGPEEPVGMKCVPGDQESPWDLKVSRGLGEHVGLKRVLGDLESLWDLNASSGTRRAHGT